MKRCKKQILEHRKPHFRSLDRGHTNCDPNVANRYYYYGSWEWHASERQFMCYSFLFCSQLKLKHSICISDFMQTTFFYHGRFLKTLANDQCSSILHWRRYLPLYAYVHTTFYHVNGLTRNSRFNGNICYILYKLQILRFYLVWQIYRSFSNGNVKLTLVCFHFFSCANMWPVMAN